MTEGISPILFLAHSRPYVYRQVRPYGTGATFDQTPITSPDSIQMTPFQPIDSFIPALFFIGGDMVDDGPLLNDVFQSSNGSK